MDVAEPARRPRVLVIDDSAVVRSVLGAILAKRGGMEVTAAPDPIVAIEKMRHVRPDVIVLDIEMPRMDGLTFLRKVMAEDPLPVVVCSGLTAEGTHTAVRALEEGAIAIVAKAQLGVRSFLEESSASLIETVRNALCARPRGRRAARVPEPVSSRPGPRVPLRPLEVTTRKVVAIGASAGGTEAIRALLEALPPDCPGLVIVQHMPEVFTRAFAERLNEICPLDVREARGGERVNPGRALIAPGNQHIRLIRDGGHYAVALSSDPPVSRHRPSVDVLFQSVARTAGQNAVGIILTGMGDDGARGLLEMKEAGARTIAQDEASSVVFGMPREAILRGGVEAVLPLPHIAGKILQLAAERACPRHK